MFVRGAIDSRVIFLVLNVPVSANLEFGPVVAIVLHSFFATHLTMFGLRRNEGFLNRVVHLRANIVIL